MRANVLMCCAALAAIVIGLTEDALAEWVTREIPVGNLPRAIGLNPVTNKVYVALESGMSVFVYEPFANAGGEFATENSPDAVAVNPITNRIYVANQASASVSVFDGTTNAVLATVPVGGSPYSLAVNPQTNKVFVVNRTSGSVSVINGVTNAVDTTLSVGTDPRSLAVNPLTNKVYVANRGSANVTVVDGNTWARTTVTVGTGPNAICVNPSTDYVYVANQGSGSVTRITGSTNATIPIGAGNNPYAIACDPVANKIYVANVVDNTVTIINGATNGTTTVPAGANPVSIAVNSATNRAYVCNLGSTFLTIIDGATNTGTSLTVGSSALCAAVNPWTGRVYVARNIGSGDGLIEIDATTNTVSTVPVGPGQTAVAVNRRTHRAYIANAPNDLVAEVDLATLSTGPLIGVGDNPTAILVDDLRNRIYVANTTGNSISVIDGQTRNVTTVTVGAGPRALAFDYRGNRLFVANTDGNSVTVVDGTSLTSTTVGVGAGPAAAAFDPVGQVCYVANRLGNSVSIIDVGLNRSNVQVGVSPAGLAVDPVSHRVFVSNSGSSSVTVIDGSKRKVACTLPVNGSPVALIVDPIRARVFVADSAGMRVTALSEPDWRRTYLTVAPQPLALAINQRSGRLYVGCLDSPQGTVVDLNDLRSQTLTFPSAVRSIGVDEDLDRALGVLTLVGDAAVVTEVNRAPMILSTAISPLPQDAAGLLQTFSGSSSSIRAPNNAGIMKVFVSLDTPALPWHEATITNGAGSSSVNWQRDNQPVSPAGLHTLLAGAIDQTGATLDNSSQAAASIVVGSLGRYLCTAPTDFTPPPPMPLPVINVEVDWLVAADHSHRPRDCELQAVQAAFFRNGYYLNIELSDAIPETAENAIISFSGNTDEFDAAASEWNALRTQYGNHTGQVGWHYCIFGHNFSRPGADPSSSGLAELGGQGGGDDFLVSLGSFDLTGTPFERASTFMHELGHNLGLHHSGDQNEGEVGQFKPNYPSIMGYRFQLIGVKNGLTCQGLLPNNPDYQNLDYSHGCLPPLDEHLLVEADGIAGNGVDWDCSGTIQGVDAVDISSQGLQRACPYDWCGNTDSLQVIRDFDDWSNITDYASLAPLPTSPLAVSPATACISANDILACRFDCPSPDPCQDIVSAPQMEFLSPSLAFSAMPTPTHGGVVLLFSLPEEDVVSLVVFDLLGRRRASLLHEWKAAGRHQVMWDGKARDGSPIPVGVYFARLQGRGFCRMERIVFAK